MRRPLDDGEPGVALRVGAALFGSVLLGAGAFAGLIATLPIVPWTGPDAADMDAMTSAITLGLFAPMSVVLLVAAWSMFVLAATGRQQRMLPRGPLAVFGVVLAVLFVGFAVVQAIDGEWLAVLTSLSVLAVMGSYAYRYWRATGTPTR